MNALESFFRHLIDYAGLFPPAELAIDQSVTEYEAARVSTYHWILGRFICPASRLGQLPARASGFPLSVILETPADGRAWFNALRGAIQSLPSEKPACLELRLPEPLALRETFEPNIAQLATLLSNAGLQSVATFVEFPRTVRWNELLPSAMRALARANLGAKIRCGGLSADAFPSCEEIANFIAACKEYSVPFKATAGLHHPVRHRDSATGFLMHGFLNLVGAAVFANSTDFPPEQLIAIVAEQDAAAFSFAEQTFQWHRYQADVSAISEARSKSFTAYGSCSFSEPIEDLKALGVLKPDGARV